MKKSLVILAAGLNRRMRIQYPKTLYKVNNQAILDYQFNIISEFFPNPYMVIGYGDELIKSHVRKNDYRIKFIKNSNYLGNVAGSLLQAAQYIQADHLTVVYGDLLFTRKSLKNIIKSPNSTLLTSPHMKNEEIGLSTNRNYKNELVHHLAFGLPIKWGQITTFSGKELKILREMPLADHSRLFGYELINKIIACGGEFNIIPGLSYDIDTKKDAKILIEGEASQYYFKKIRKTIVC